MNGDTVLLEQAGRRAFSGFRLQTLVQTTSTQDVVRAAARDGAAEGFCCLATSQTDGRGRQGRSWTVPAGTALLASLLLRRDRPVAGGVPIATGLAVRAAIASVSGCRCQVKWPNDILADGRKLAGILCEVEPGAPGQGTAIVVGVGVNLRVPFFPPNVPGVSLDELVGTPLSCARLLAAVLEELSARLPHLSAGGLGPLREEWMAHAAGVGELVTAASGGGTVTGVVEGIDEDGALLLRGGSDRIRVLAGDVHLLHPSSPVPRAAT